MHNDNLTVPERIASLSDAIRMARYNARTAAREGDLTRSRLAYTRAREYVGRIRVLREVADAS